MVILMRIKRFPTESARVARVLACCLSATRHAEQKAQVGGRVRMLAIAMGLSFVRWRDALPRPATAHFGARYALDSLQSRCLRICIDGAVGSSQTCIPSVVHINDRYRRSHVAKRSQQVFTRH